MSDRDIGDEFEDDGDEGCGHTDEEHEAMRQVAKMLPVGAVSVVMTLPVAEYDRETGRPIFDTDDDTGYGLMVTVDIPGARALEVARNLLTSALAKVNAGIDAKSSGASDEDIEAAVAAFDPDAAIEHLLGGTYDAPPPASEPTGFEVNGKGEASPKRDDDPPTGLYL